MILHRAFLRTNVPYRWNVLINLHLSRAKRARTGSGGLPPGKFFMTTPFRSLENAPFLENVPLTEAKDHD